MIKVIKSCSLHGLVMHLCWSAAVECGRGGGHCVLAAAAEWGRVRVCRGGMPACREAVLTLPTHHTVEGA